MRMRVWVIGGTREAVEMATALAAAGIPCLVTVTTEAARRSYRENHDLKVLVGGLEVKTLETFIATQSIGAVLDASHPFAVEISRGAIAAAQSLQLPYWRYERPAIEQSTADGLVHYVEDLNAVLNPTMLAGERVLLTLGYRWLHHFSAWQTQATLFARILPSPVALAAALGAGFTADRLIALRPPISADLELALWQQWHITRVITKASGAPGGEDTKRVIAEQLGISLIILNRPSLSYPAVCHSPADALEACRTWWHSFPRHS